MKCDEIFTALDLLEKERGISPAFMMDKIIQALTTAYKKDHEGVENVIVDVDEVRRDLKMYVQKEIVDGSFEPNAESTIKKKGSDKPLIDTGTMRQSVTYVVRKVGEGG